MFDINICFNLLSCLWHKFDFSPKEDQSRSDFEIASSGKVHPPRNDNPGDIISYRLKCYNF